MTQPKIKIKKGDKVEVISGKDRGKQGEVERVFPRQRRVLVAGVNLIKKHQRPWGNRAGGIITVPRPLDVSKVMLICPHCKQKTRVGYRGEKKDKVRFCRKCEQEIKS